MYVLHKSHCILHNMSNNFFLYAMCNLFLLLCHVHIQELKDNEVFTRIYRLEDCEIKLDEFLNCILTSHYFINLSCKNQVIR